MSTQRDSREQNRVSTIGLVASLVVGILWVVFEMTGAPHWMLVVNVVLSILVGGWWAFGHRFLGGGRQRNRNRG